MKVRHQLVVAGTCPVDGAADTYHCDVLVRDRVLRCEAVVRAVQEVTAHGPIFQEELTQRLADRLQAPIQTVGTHAQGRVTTTVVCRPAPGREQERRS